VGIFWIEAERFVKVCDGAIEILLVSISVAAGDESSAKIRIEADRLVEVGNRAVEITFIIIRSASPFTCGPILVEQRGGLGSIAATIVNAPKQAWPA
jgi:hypothetical protein